MLYANQVNSGTLVSFQPGFIRHEDDFVFDRAQVLESVNMHDKAKSKLAGLYLVMFAIVTLWLILLLPFWLVIKAIHSTYTRLTSKK